MLITDILTALAGLVVLLVAGDVLVRGAVALSLRLGIPALIVSLTVIAFGTSAPELLISVKSALEGAPGLAFGNVLGSNVANVLLVLGAPALISPLVASDDGCRRTYLMMIFATLVYIALCFLGPLVWWHGMVLLAILAWMLTDALRAALGERRAAAEVDEIEDGAADMAVWKISTYLALGLVGLPVGANLLVDGARAVAIDFGVSEAVIGLTLVAIGTSLPELATTVAAALRRHGDVAIGNVLGSNLFNIVAIMGITSFFGPLDVPPEFLRFDLWVMLAASLLLAPVVWRVIDMGRTSGAVFLALYGIYMLVILH